jgi:hypothetical protein
MSDATRSKMWVAMLAVKKVVQDAEEASTTSIDRLGTTADEGGLFLDTELDVTGKDASPAVRPIQAIVLMKQG